MATVQNNSYSTNKLDHFGQSINLLLEGIHQSVTNLKKISETKRIHFIIELEQMHSFLTSFAIMYENMPEQIVRNTVLNTIKNMSKKWPDLPTNITSRLHEIPLNSKTHLPEFLHTALSYIGPVIRLSSNEMKAWITVDKQLAPLFTRELIINALGYYGITVGVSYDAIDDLIESKRFDEEVLIAEGIPSKPGQNGKLEFIIQVDDLGKTPKMLENGSVSFKDIKQYEYASAGDRLAKIIPPIPGETGITVTNKLVYAVDVQAAHVPRIKYAKLSNDEKYLLITEDCCISKQYGHIHLEPTVRIEGSVSFASGNIDSNVSVMVTEGVNTGFSIHSKRDIIVHGIVEGAELISDGNITIKGGIQGKEKAQIEAGGDIYTKLISNATVRCVGDLYVEIEILNSKIVSDAKVVLSQSPAQITGGVVEADLEISANSIGSEMGVSTIVKLGGKTESLLHMLHETETQIDEQETRLDTCQQLLQNLEMQKSSSSINIDEMEKAVIKTKQMQSTVQDRLDELYQEQEDLTLQLEDNTQQPRSLKVKKTIWNGTKIIISGVELDIHEPTGPVMAVLNGEEISLLPFSST